MNDMIQKSFEVLSRKAKADGVEIELLVSGAESLSLSYQAGKIDEFESSHSQSLGVRVVDGGAQGYASTEKVSPEALERTYAEALANARMLEAKRQETALPLMGPRDLPDAMTDLHRPQEIPMEKKLAVARDLEALTLKAHESVHKVPYSSFSESEGWVQLMNSKGLNLQHRRSSYSGYAYALAKKGEVSKMGGDSFYTRDFDSIDVAELAKTAAQRATQMLDAKPGKTEKLPVIWDSRVSSTLLQMLLASLSGKSVLEKTSLLSDRLGQKVASSLFHLVDDPFNREGTGLRPFDSEGAPSQKTDLIAGGELKAFLTNLEIAQKLKMPHTASASRSPSSSMSVGPSNLVVERGQTSMGEMLKAAPRMLLLTSFTGGLHAGFRAASGDFSLPAEGMIVERGEIVGAIDGFVLSGNVLEALKDISAVGTTYSGRPSSMLVPDLLIGQLSVAGGA